MVQKFDTASNGDNQIPDHISSNSMKENGSMYGADLQDKMNVAPTFPVSATNSSISNNSVQTGSWWGRLSLSTKATVLAVTLSVVPVLGIGAIDYALVNQTIKQEIAQNKSSKTLSNLLLGTGITALLAGIVAVLLAKRAVEPILEAASAVQKLAQGDLDTRLNVAGEDELAILGSSINRMVSQVQTLLSEQKASALALRTYAETVNAASRGDKQFLFDRAAFLRVQ